MGAGKSTVGPILARAIGLRFADLDALIEEEAGVPVAEIFRVRGEPAFRELESLCLARLASTRERLVIAAGGGAPIVDRNRRFFAEQARTFYLACPFTELMARTAGGAGAPSSPPVRRRPGACMRRGRRSTSSSGGGSTHRAQRRRRSLAVSWGCCAERTAPYQADESAGTWWRARSDSRSSLPS
jgi:hypothetical protein